MLITDFSILTQQLKIFLLWIEGFRNFIAKFADFNTNGIELILMNQEFPETIFEILQKTYPLNQQQENVLFSTTSSQKINKILNEIKAKTLKSLNMLLKYILKTNNLGFSIMEALPNFLHLIYPSIMKYNEIRIKFPHLCEKQSENFAIQTLVFLHKLCLFRKYQDFFHMNQYVIFYDILLPFIIADNEEINNFNENPEKFRDVTQTYCSNKEDLETLKGMACSLLKTMSRYIDGFLTHIFDIIREILVFSVLSNDVNEIEKNYPKIKEIVFAKSYFLETSQECRIETCLMIFACLNQEVLSRQDLMFFVKKKYFFYFKILESLLKSYWSI